jgi:hypothetical protein
VAEPSGSNKFSDVITNYRGGTSISSATMKNNPIMNSCIQKTQAIFDSPYSKFEIADPVGKDDEVHDLCFMLARHF